MELGNLNGDLRDSSYVDELKPMQLGNVDGEESMASGIFELLRSLASGFAGLLKSMKPAKTRDKRSTASSYVAGGRRGKHGLRRRSGGLLRRMRKGPIDEV